MQGAAAIHLIYGPIGAGKSTYARKLTQERQAIRFAIDDWMAALFGDDRPEPLTMAWAAERVGRCEKMIWQLSKDILASGRDVVLELGAMRKNDRSRIRGIANNNGYPIQFYFVSADRDIRRQRVLQRNEQKGETWSLHVTPAMFDAMDTFFESPSTDELSLSLQINGEINHG
jgi:predicted kinase